MMMDVAALPDCAMAGPADVGSQCDVAQTNAARVRAKTDNKTKEIKECRVCGDSTTGTYFGAVVCLPCKTFFIRYGSEGSRRLRCRSDNHCSITIATRTRCKRCRLMKCYSVGMMRKERPEVMHAGHGQELCSVCCDIANGIHFGTYTCEGCKKFFRRGLKESQSYRCSKGGGCVVNPRSRNTCRYCRFNKCLAVGMTPKVRVGRPRKAQREYLLSSLQKMAARNRELATTMSSSSSSSGGVELDGQSGGSPGHYGDSPPPSAGPRAEDLLSESSAWSSSYSPHSSPSSSSSSSSSPSFPPSASSSRLSFSYDASVTESDENGPYVTLRGEMRMDTQSQTDHEKRAEVVGERRRGSASHQAALGVTSEAGAGRPRRDSGEERSHAAVTQKPAAHLGKVHVGDFTYLLSDLLSQRYLQVVLPYWTHPLLPPGGAPCHPSQQAVLRQLTAAHVQAVDSLRGPPPSAAVLAEAALSSELTENVGEFLRLRLVRILNSFITFVKSQNGLLDIAEQDMAGTIRMTVNTWSLIGAATRYFDPETGTLPHLQDVPLHPDNPHSPLNARNLHMARKLHKLQLDDTEAALLAVTCILATDIVDMTDVEEIEDKRWQILELFRAYTTAKYGWPNWRMEELFACVPEMRLAAIWFNDLSYTTWFPPKHCHQATS